MRQPTTVVGAALTKAIPYTEQLVHQPTYRAALVYKPTARGSVYFDYGTSFNPSAESLSLSVATSLLPPEQNETYEVGAKYSFLNERLMLDGAWFRTTKLNARETDPTNSNNIVLAGNQMVRGVQASAVGRLERRDGPGAGLRVPGQRGVVFKAVSDVDWVPAGECAAADVQCVLDEGAAGAVQCRIWRELCGEPDGELDGAVYAADVWAADHLCNSGRHKCDGVPGVVDGNVQAGAGVLGVQRDAEETGDGSP